MPCRLQSDHVSFSNFFTPNTFMRKFPAGFQSSIFIRDQKSLVESSLGDFSKLPKHTLIQGLNWLTAAECCKVQELNKSFGTVVEQSRYWINLYKKEFGEMPVNEVTLASPKSLYVEEYKRRHPNIRGTDVSPEEMDYKQGYRYIVHSEFLESWRHLWHFFVIPLKIAGYMLLPVKLFAQYRYFNLQSPFSATNEQRIYNYATSFTGRSWWNAHLTFFLEPLAPCFGLRQ